MVFVFDFGLGQGGAIVNAPVDRLEAFVDVALCRGNRRTRRAMTAWYSGFIVR